MIPRVYLLSGLSILLFFVAALSSIASNVEVENVLNNYVRHVVSEDWDEAKKYWDPQIMERSDRLGINLTDIVAKYDCGSPLIYSLEMIRSENIKVSVVSTKDYGNYSTGTVQFVSGPDTVNYVYYLTNNNRMWKITSPLYFFTSDWQSIQTRFANVYFCDSTKLNSDALREIDECVERVCQMINVDAARMNLLENIKIDYFLCSKDDIKLLTGYDAKGITNFQYDAIVTQYLPHYHELAHLLFNFSLKEVPLYTLPLIQEGLAVAVGGRWGKSPRVVMQLGPTIIRENLCQLDNLLTRKEFNQEAGPADITYPIAGIFADMLLKQFGIECFQDIYLQLSGSSEEVNNMAGDFVISIIEKFCRTDWGTIKRRFDNYVNDFEFSGLLPGVSDSGILVKNLDNGNLRLSIKESEEYYNFIIQSNKDKPDGIVLLKDKIHSIDTTYNSWMFQEQMPGSKYEGEEYGIRFDTNEAGVYNYPTNTLETKYVSAFSPSKYYLDDKASSICFRLEKSILDINLQSIVIYLKDLSIKRE